MKLMIFALVLVLSSAAQAKDITITLNEDEQKAAIQLLDMAVKAGGLQAADAGIVLARKIMQAAQQQPAPLIAAPKADDQK